MRSIQVRRHHRCRGRRRLPFRLRWRCYHGQRSCSGLGSGTVDGTGDAGVSGRRCRDRWR